MEDNQKSTKAKDDVVYSAGALSMVGFNLGRMFGGEHVIMAINTALDSDLILKCL